MNKNRNGLKLKKNPPSNPWIREEIKTEIARYTESSERRTPYMQTNGTKLQQVRGKLVVLNAFSSKDKIPKYQNKGILYPS